MVEEEARTSETSVTMADKTLAPPPKKAETLEIQASVEATVDSAAQGGTDSTCNNNAESSAATSDGDLEKTLEFANELADRGTNALKQSDYAEAADCFSRALEIRVAHYGELAFECLNAYYQYGRALLYKAQEEADPLGNVPKKESESQQESDKDGSVKNAINTNTESSAASVSSNAEPDASSIQQAGEADDVSGGKDQEENSEDSDAEDLTEADEDESDLDLAWKMLDIARAISEKHSGDTMEKVDILSALAEVSLEREDIESSLSDYQEALSILGRLVEPDSRLIAELNFRICLCLEIGAKPLEAIPYCKKAISVCKSRLQRLMDEVKNSLGFVQNSLGSATSSAASEMDECIEQSSNVSQTDKSMSDKEAEIETLSGLSEDLEKKLEDLQQLALNPKSILSEILGLPSVKAKSGYKGASSSVISSSQMGTANSNPDLDSPTVSTAHTNGASGVTHLGVVGRGVKRVVMSIASAESNPTKKRTLDPSSDNGDGSACS